MITFISSTFLTGMFTCLSGSWRTHPMGHIEHTAVLCGCQAKDGLHMFQGLKQTKKEEYVAETICGSQSLKCL